MQGGRGLFRRSWWQRGRVQLGGGLLLATVLPFGIAIWVSPAIAQLELTPISFWASAVGVSLGFWFTRSLNVFPGPGISFSVLPVVSSCFLGVFAGLLMLRLEYSRPLLLSGWIVSTAWFYAIHAYIARKQSLCFAVLPYGRIDVLQNMKGVEWAMLSHPEYPRNCMGVVADFEFGLPAEWEEFLAECTLKGIPVFHYKQLRESLTGQVEIKNLSQNTFGSLIPNNSYLVIKLIGDFFVSVSITFLILPVLLLIAILIRLDSPGPIIFKQQRVGYRGQHFKVWKFRTMKVRPLTTAGDEAAVRDAITMAEDRRVTTIGKFLRRSRMDELPQLINVVRGEMSLIGPRPEAEVLSRWYQKEIPFYRYRHVVRPGISGWAQVNQGHVSSVEEVLEKLNYDFYYISNFGFWLDLLIFFKTIKTIISGEGSR